MESGLVATDMDTADIVTTTTVVVVPVDTARAVTVDMDTVQLINTGATTVGPWLVETITMTTCQNPLLRRTKSIPSSFSNELS